mmetsp:Transcript_645/g.2698  ORF Transcript_645/g.2698 Transcript_645/m.2698 type:complete len:219 (+) Transcript_645:50-706(+)
MRSLIRHLPSTNYRQSSPLSKSISSTLSVFRKAPAALAVSPALRCFFAFLPLAGFPDAASSSSALPFLFFPFLADSLPVAFVSAAPASPASAALELSWSSDWTRSRSSAALRLRTSALALPIGPSASKTRNFFASGTSVSASLLTRTFAAVSSAFSMITLSCLRKGSERQCLLCFLKCNMIGEISSGNAGDWLNNPRWSMNRKHRLLPTASRESDDAS